MKPCLRNISFIVIALNEEFAIQKCLESIYRLETQNCELICVDSDSKDNTLEIMKQYAEKIPNTKIFKIKGDCNAAIARNVGIDHAKKDYIFFIDGDVEISEDFLVFALNRLQDCGAAAGNLEDFEYDKNYDKILKTTSRYAYPSETFINYTGGIFIARKDVVDKVGFFDENLMINEDVDFSLRLRKLKPILYTPLSMGQHHTVPYTDHKRLRQKIKNQHGIYTGMLLKKHIVNKNIISFLRTQSDLFFGIPFYGFSILFGLGCKIIPYAFTILFLIVISDMAYGLYQKKKITHRFFMHYLNPFFVLKGFLGFFKKRVLEYAIERVV